MNIKVTVSGGGMSIKDLREMIKQKAPDLVQRMAEEARDEAERNFSGAIYPGKNDVKVYANRRKKLAWQVSAKGKSVAFIEFGTSTFDNNHPDAGRLQIVHGAYANVNPSYGKRGWWFYKGEPGNAAVRPEPKEYKSGRVYVYPDDIWFTIGNPANMSLHKAKMTVAENITRIAKEVFT